MALSDLPLLGLGVIEHRELEGGVDEAVVGLHGGRQHGDYNNPTFRAYGRGVTEAIARDLGRHPALIAWQTPCPVNGS